ncbi:hypothetical protein FACS1894216_20630 [Synergistales bacterium]|nr:hypothetical protein FACS1894216_20630 [Synergistales bacterium]
MLLELQEHDLRIAICEIGRRMYDKSLVAATDGNISVRTDGGVLITPSGVCKGGSYPRHDTQSRFER